MNRILGATLTRRGTGRRWTGGGPGPVPTELRHNRAVDRKDRVAGNHGQAVTSLHSHWVAFIPWLNNATDKCLHMALARDLCLKCRSIRRIKSKLGQVGLKVTRLDVTEIFQTGKVASIR